MSVEVETNPWLWWQEALAGRRGELTKGYPEQGYYRDRDRAIAIWREDGALCCLVTGGYQPHNDDEVDDLFGFCSTNPISIETYDAFVNSGRWPEDPTAEIEAARGEPGLGHNSGQPEAEILDELATIRTAFDGWLAEIGGTIATEEHDAKVKAYTDRVADLKKKATEAHRVEKEPHLKAGREVDERWRLAKEKADKQQREMASVALDYRKAREERREADAKAQREAAAEARRQAGSANAPAPIAAPIRKQATGMRSVKVVVIDDLAALAAQLAKLNPPDFRETCERLARRMLEAGAEVQGARLDVQKVAA